MEGTSSRLGAFNSPNDYGHHHHHHHRLDLPPGFRFHPTDEELVIHYLKNKVSSRPLPVPIIAEIDLYKFDPWELPAKANAGEHEWYFFTPRDRKYPNGARPNRAAGSGYWKATGTDKPIISVGCSSTTQKLGVKKALVFYKGRPPKGIKTNWIMHEYRLAVENNGKPNSFASRRSLRLDDWVLCRIYKKSSHAARLNTASEAVCVDEVLASLPNMEDVDVNAPQQQQQLPRLGSLGRLIMGVSDPFLESLVAAEQASNPSVGVSSVDPRNSWTSMAQLDSTVTNSSGTMLKGGNIPQTSRCDPSLLKLDSFRDEAHSRTGVQSSSTVSNGFPSLFPVMLQQKAQSSSESHVGGEMTENSFRWPFAEGRTKIHYS